MKKKLVLLCVVLLSTGLIAGCAHSKESAQTNSGKSYWDYESGIQSYLGDWHERIVMQEKGFYFGDPSDGMLYYYDYKVKKAIPVCSKPDCSHQTPTSGGDEAYNADDQPEEEFNSQTSVCDAYIGRSVGNMTIVNNRLYYCMSSSEGGVVKRSICSVSMDGSDHRTDIKDYVAINYNSIPSFDHFTGKYLFFSTNADVHKSEVSVINLTTKEKSILYTFDSDNYYADVPTIHQDFIYYVRWTMDGSLNGSLFRYSLKTKETKELYTGVIVGYTFVNDQIYYSDEKSICKMSLNGENQTPVFDAPGRLALRYDGQYLYLDDAEFAGVGKTDFKPVQVVKLDGTLVDSIERVGMPIYGDQNIFFLAYSYKGSISGRLGYMKKSEIGQKHFFYDLVTGEEIDEDKLWKLGE